MIRRLLTPLVLIVGAWLCALACVGALAAACAIWLASYWGPLPGALATAGVFAVLSLLLGLIAWLCARSATRRPVQNVSDTVENFWRAHPAGLLGGAFALAFLIGRRPGLLVRAVGGVARSTAFLVLLRRLF